MSSFTEHKTRRKAEIWFGLALLATLDIKEIPAVLKEYMRLRDMDYEMPHPKGANRYE